MADVGLEKLDLLPGNMVVRILYEMFRKSRFHVRSSEICVLHPISQQLNEITSLGFGLDWVGHLPLVCRMFLIDLSGVNVTSMLAEFLKVIW